MARYLSQLDIDVSIYIAEGDKEYQHDLIEDLKIHERIWRDFSELALFPERLQQEVGLSPREAKKIAHKRLTAPFQSLADVESIEKIAKASIHKVKDFSQKQCMVEFTGIPEKEFISVGTNKAPQKQIKKKKKTDANADIFTSALFLL